MAITKQKMMKKLYIGLGLIALLVLHALLFIFVYFSITSTWEMTKTNFSCTENSDCIFTNSAAASCSVVYRCSSKGAVINQTEALARTSWIKEYCQKEDIHTIVSDDCGGSTYTFQEQTKCDEGYCIAVREIRKI